MKRHFNKILAFLFLVLASGQTSYAQLSVPNYTACPGQLITASATWNNASSITYSLYAAPGGTTSPPILTFASTNTFNISNSSAVPAVINYTLIAVGIYGTLPTTNIATFNLTIAPPAPMILTQVSNGNFCNGTNATIIAPIGGTTYSYSGPSVTQGTSPSNVIVFPVQTNNTGPVTITSVIGGCTVSGVSNIQVSPVLILAISNVVNACQSPNACVTLSAGLSGASANWQWFDNYNTAVTTNTNQTGNTASVLICTLTANNTGTYSVHVDQTFNGIYCPYTASTQINIVPTNPVVLAASPSNVVCQGVNLNLTATAGNNNPTFLWNGPGFTSNIANPSISPALPVNSGNYSVVATFQGAFIACTTSAVINVSIVPVSQPVITMPASVCQGTTFVVSGTAGSNPISYSWSGPLFTGGVPTNNAVVTITNAPTSASGTQYLTANFQVNATQCSATSSVQLNVVPVSTVTVVPPTPVCEPTNAFLQALATGANQYLWIGPNQFNTPTQNGNAWVYYPDANANGIYTVTAYFNGGSNLVCSNTNTVQLSVNPVLHFSVVPRQEVCYNTPVNLIGPSGATSYSWTSSTGFTSSSKDVNFTSAQPINAGTYTITVALGPCVSSAETELSVLTPLVFTLTPFDRTICKGDTIYVEGGATGGSENYAYTWNPPVYLESSTGPKQMGIPLGSVNYNLIVYDIACPNFTIGHSFNVTVNQPPIPDLHLPKGAGCEPLSLFLDSRTESVSYVTTYDFGGGDIVQGDSIHHTLKNAGIYTLTVYSKGKAQYGGCSGTYVYPYPITVYQSPHTEISLSPETPTTNDEIVFYPSSKTEPISRYLWNFLGGSTPGDTNMVNSPGKSDTTNVKNPTRIYTNYGTYPVVLISTNQYGCTDTVFKAVKIIDELQIYVPNTFTPNDDGINDVFMAKGTGMKVEGFTMDIFNRAGINIFTTKDINQGWDGKVKGQVVKDATYIYRIRIVGMNGEGRKEISGYVTIIK